MKGLRQYLRDLAIEQKLVLTTLVTITASLVITCGGLLAFDQLRARARLVRDLGMMAEVIGFNTAGGLAFNDAEAVANVLAGFKAHPNIRAACVFDARGKPFATYREEKFHEPWPEPRANAEEFGRDSLKVFRRIKLGGDTLGTIYLRSDLREMQLRAERYALTAGMMIVVGALVGVFIARRLQRVISEPISELAGIARKVAAENNYTVRGRKTADDELGHLIDGFNHMLTQIEARDGALQAARDQLEVRVARRTSELARSVSLLNATIESTDDGILAIDRAGRILCYNAKFAQIWNLSSHILDSGDRAAMLPFIAAQFNDPEAFLRRTEEVHQHPETRSFDELELADGRTIERYTHPQVLDGTVVGVVISCRDVTARKLAERELARAHRELLETSRLAGKAEVATAVLHNVGNVLTSVNVSSTLLSNQVRNSKASMIGRVSALVRENAPDLPGFLTHDLRGRQLPDYLAGLSECVDRERADMLREIESLQKNIEHIKDIVAMQQSYAKVSGVAETLPASELIEDALRMNASALERHEVACVRELGANPIVTTDKHKVLQILVNLIRNAKYACDESGRADKLLRVRVTEQAGHLYIDVIDNGVGIPAENLTRIFSHGFTTRVDGHGFGLHSGALAAKELGGTLTAQSDGPGCGAMFRLSLPLQFTAAV